MYKPNGTGLTRILNATRCSFDGIGYAWRHESAFRQELMLCLVMLPLAFVVTREPVELILLISPLVLLLIVECINSAIEAAIDRISTELHPLSKQAKDLGSSAVFFTMMLIAISWGIIGLPKLF